MPNANEKPVLIFVHGFGKKKRGDNRPARCWDQLLILLREDARIGNNYELRVFEYPTQWFSLNPLQRIPTLKEISEKLCDFIDSPEFYERKQVTLIGHSQGGLVIQHCLVRFLQDKHGERLSQIRQVILMATPNLGSTLMSPLRTLVSVFSTNPQERALRVLNPEIADMRKVILQQVTGAAEASPTECPIPIHAFYGFQDGVVVEASAKGDFANATGIDGDHFSLIRPASRDETGYQEIVEALLEPSGHPRVFEIDLYETKLTIRPVSGEQPLPGNHARRKGKIATDNIANLTRSATFSYKNRCTDLFTIRYATKSGGYLYPRMSQRNEASYAEQERYDTSGEEVVFSFTPREPGKRYTLDLDIYRGFSEGERNVHFHLRKHSYYKRLKYTVDLSSYVAEGYRVTQAPKLYFHDHEPETHDICESRGLGRVLEPVSVDPSGVWNWELENVRQGVVDFGWDVGKPVTSTI